MTDIEAKALALVNEVRTEHGFAVSDSFDRDEYSINEVICRAIEQHEAFKQEVSDTVHAFVYESGTTDVWEKLNSFIIPKPKPKPDPLVDAIRECDNDNTYCETVVEYAAKLRAALEARGLEIREKGQ
jgi:hypothetical protein